MYQIDGRDVVFAWLSREPNMEQRAAMLDRLAELAIDPLKAAQRVPGVLAPVYVAVLPLAAAPVVVRFLLAEQFQTVKILGIGPLP